MAEQSPLIRQWIMLRTLSARRYGAAIKELIGELGVSEKTVRRDLDALRAAGFPLEEIVEEHGRKKWRLDPEKTQPGMAFTFDEVIALYLGRRLLEPLAGTVFWDAAQRAFRKVRACLGPSALRYVDKFASIFHQTAVGASDYAGKGDLIDRLMQAIEDRRIALLTYQSLRATEPVSYDVYAYGMTYHRGSLYLVGHRPEDGKTCHWKVDRIEGVELQELRFNRPEDFDLKRHFEKSFGIFAGQGEVQHVKVRFSPSVARYVQESNWHASQRLTKAKDGVLIAEFDLSSTEEIQRWIMSFGQHAMVMEPEELREAILAEIRALAESYAAAQRTQARR